jgi:hypothetical protein
MARNYEKHPIAETTHDIAVIAVCLGLLAIGIEAL